MVRLANDFAFLGFIVESFFLSGFAFLEGHDSSLFQRAFVWAFQAGG